MCTYTYVIYICNRLKNLLVLPNMKLALTIDVANTKFLTIVVANLKF